MQQFIKLILPEKAEILFTLTLSLLLLFVLNIKRFWVMLDGDSAIVASDQSSLDSVLTNGLANLDKYINPSWLDIAMWLIIGCVGFLVVSTITAIIKTTEEEAELLHYFANPKGRHHEVIAFLSKVVVRIAAVAIGLIWVMVFFETIMPFCVKLFFTSATSLSDYSSWLWLPLSVIIFAASLYVFAIITRLIALRTRIL